MDLTNGLLFVIVFAWAAQCAVASYENCDIVLTPNQTIHAPGKTMYFDGSDGVVPEQQHQQRRRHQPIDASDVDADGLALATASGDDEQQQPPQPQQSLVPWEQPLKHALYLVLNNKIDEQWNGSDVIADHDIQSAIYISRGPRYLPKFGDIITLANGRMDRGEFGELFILETEENCVKRCNEDASLSQNSTATWMVEKIRHRDEKRGHRYEFRISVMPVKKPVQGSKRDAKAYVIEEKPKSFLIKDVDYPRYFELLDSFDPAQSLDRADRRLFDTRYDRMLIPFQLNYNKPQRNVAYGKQPESVHGLNIGEYYARPALFTSPQATQKVFQQEAEFNYPPTAFRDTIPIGTGLERLNYLPKSATNLHRHIYLNKIGAPLFTASAYEEESAIDPHTNTGAVLFPTAPELPRPTISKSTGYNSLARYKGRYVVPTEVNRVPPNTVSPQPTAADKLNQILAFPYELNSHIASGEKYQYQLEHTFGTAPGGYYGDEIPTGPTKSPSLQTAQQYSSSQQGPANEFRANYAYQAQEFSDPDPLYHGPLGPILVTPVNYRSSADGSLNAGEIASQPPPTRAPAVRPITEQPSHEPTRSPSAVTVQPKKPPVLLITPRRKYPDSINAQLPLADENTDYHVPYVDASSPPVVTEKEYNVNIIDSGDEELHTQQSSQVTTTEAQTRQPELQSKIHGDTQTKKPLAATNAPKKASIRLRNRSRENGATTEKPVLKWVPKRSHVTKVTKSPLHHDVSSGEQRDAVTSSSADSKSSESTSQEDVIIVTPVNAKKQPEASTKLSVSKSVSVRVGAKRTATTTEKHDVATAATVTPPPTKSEERTYLPTPAPDAVLGNATQPYIYFNDTQSGKPQPDERVVTKLVKTIKKRQRKIS